MKSLKDTIVELLTSDKFKTTNDQYFYSAPYDRPLNVDGYIAFKVGTVNGIWLSDKEAIIILAVMNNKPGNGHFVDLFDWFEVACIQAELPLIFKEVDNLKEEMPSLQLSGTLAKHLVEKRGFKRIEGTDDYIKELPAIQKDVQKKLDDKIYIKCN